MKKSLATIAKVSLILCLLNGYAFGNFRDKVIDKAVKEINRVTMFKVVYSYIKKARSVVEIKFDINMRYH